MSMLFAFKEESFQVEVNKLCKMSHTRLTALLVDQGFLSETVIKPFESFSDLPRDCLHEGV